MKQSRFQHSQIGSEQKIDCFHDIALFSHHPGSREFHECFSFDQVLA